MQSNELNAKHTENSVYLNAPERHEEQMAQPNAVKISEEILEPNWREGIV